LSSDQKKFEAKCVQKINPHVKMKKKFLGRWCCFDLFPNQSKSQFLTTYPLSYEGFDTNDEF